MTDPEADWETRLAHLWAALDAHESPAFIAAMAAHVALLPAGHPVGLYEQGGAHDSTGDTARAVPLYEAALAAGLAGPRRRQAVIQMASSLRALGNATRAAQLLTAELAQPDDELTGAVRGFLALALVDLGREREAVAVSLTALSACLPRYNRSLARYAQRLVEPSP